MASPNPKLVHNARSNDVKPMGLKSSQESGLNRNSAQKGAPPEINVQRPRLHKIDTTNPMANSAREKPVRRFGAPQETKTSRLRATKMAGKEGKPFGDLLAKANHTERPKEIGKQASTRVGPSGVAIETLDQSDNIICATEPNDFLQDNMEAVLMDDDDGEELLTVNLTPSGKSKQFKFSEAAVETSRSGIVSSGTATPKNDTGRLSNLGRAA